MSDMLTVAQRTASDFGVSEAFVDRWDREWLAYLGTEAMGQHVVPSSRLTRVRRLADEPADEVYEAVLSEHPSYGHRSPLHVWAPARALRGKDIAEIGCGTGFLSRQLSSEVKSYLGIDASRLAIAVAAGCAAPNCRFLHINDADQIQVARGSCDSVVAREFFIHQNFNDALQVLALASFLLRPRGKVYADFFMHGPAVSPEAKVYPARSVRDMGFPSAGFEFSDDDLQSLAHQSNFSVVEQTKSAERSRRFVTLQAH